MRVVPCKIHESFVIGDVKFTVLQVRGARVRLRVDAPRDVPVHRGEVLRDLSRAASEALGAGPATG